MLETIEVKGAGMTEHYVTQLEFQDLQERYRDIRERTKVWLTVFHTNPLKMQCLELCLFKDSFIGGNDSLVKTDRTKKCKMNFNTLNTPLAKPSTIVRI